MNREKYVREVLKQLNCSKERKNSIHADLQADIAAALEAGESWEQVLMRMGTPAELAAEFNENMGSGPKPKGKKKTLLIVLAVIGVLLIAGGIFISRMIPRSYEMGTTGEFDADMVQGSAEEIVELLNTGDYAALQERSIEVMKPLMTEEKMEEVKTQAGDDWGEFEKFTGYIAAEMKQNGQLFAVTEVTALYENRSIIYRITFDTDMRLAGIYLR